MPTIDDPRIFPLDPGAPSATAARWLEWAERALSSATGQQGDGADAALRRGIVDALLSRDIGAVISALRSAPSPVMQRQLLRAIQAAWSDGALDRQADVVAHAFALPVVVVAASDSARELPMIIDDVAAARDLLRAHRLLGANESFGIANVMAGRDAVGIESLGRWLDWRAAGEVTARDVEPAPLPIAAGRQGAHLRFLVGAALAAPGADLFRGSAVENWGMPLARELSRQLAAPATQLLALPREPAAPLIAWQRGQLAHREVALQLFASDAIRRLRATHGEPTAVISAHRGDGSGELRVSLSSVFGDLDAEGFRCPLFAFDRIDDVLSVIVALLRECRVGDIRVIAGIHGDREPGTGLPLFFRADVVGSGESVPFH